MDDIIVSAPGKVILHGEHAVVYGKPAIAASLNLRTYLLLSACSQNVDEVHLVLPNIDVKRSWKVTDIQNHIKLPVSPAGDPVEPTDEQLNILAGLAGVQRNSTISTDLALISFLYLYTAIAGQAGELPSLTIKVVSSIPIGAGLGSSASFSVTLVTALLLQKKQIKPMSMTIDDQKTVQWSTVDLECINKWAFQGERIMHGSPSGIDNSVSTFGGALKFQAGKITRLDRMPSLKILLTSTNVPRSTKTLVMRFRTLYEKDPDIMKPIVEAVGGITEKCQQVYFSMATSETLEHFTTLEKLIDDNQRLLQIMDVSHVTIQKICHVTSKYGLHTKLTGAGGGGCTFTLLRPDTTDELIDRMKQDLAPDGFKCWETQIGGHGVQLHSSNTNIQSLSQDILIS